MRNAGRQAWLESTDAPAPTSAYEPREKIPGTGYVVQRVIGRGGQATAYEVTNSIGKPLVLKALHTRLLAREFQSRLEAEARALVQLEHRNIVSVYELGRTAENPPRAFMVMELLSGGNVREVLARAKQIELPAALVIGASVADALAHAHTRNVVHLDVKPDNIFVHVRSDGTSVVKLLDFGLMRLLDSDGATRALCGTPGYGAPEQLLGDPVSSGTDIYALGLVLYEMLAGRRPFPADTRGLSSVVAARLSSDAPPLSQWVLVPREVEDLVMSCIERRPERRPAKASVVARTLWDAHERAARRAHRSSPYVTVQSLVGLAAERRRVDATTALVEATGRGRAFDPDAATEPRALPVAAHVAATESLNAWPGRPAENDGEAGAIRARRRRAIVVAAWACAGMLAVGFAAVRLRAPRPPAAPAVSPMETTQLPAPPSDSPVVLSAIPSARPDAPPTPRVDVAPAPALPLPSSAPRRAPRRPRPAAAPGASALPAAEPLLEWLERPEEPQHAPAR